MAQRKLIRDRVVSIVNGRELVGVYFADTNGYKPLIECSPSKSASPSQVHS